MTDYKDKLDEWQRAARRKARELDEKYDIKGRVEEGARVAQDAAKRGAETIAREAERARTEAERLVGDEQEVRDRARHAAEEAARRARGGGGAPRRRASAATSRGGVTARDTPPKRPRDVRAKRGKQRAAPPRPPEKKPAKRSKARRVITSEPPRLMTAALASRALRQPPRAESTRLGGGFRG